MKDTIITKVEKYMWQEHMLRQGMKILVGVSGGADSVGLLEILLELAPGWELSLFAVHVHHGIRGEAADADARYVEQFCAARGIPCRIFREDIPAWASRMHMSLEEAGRTRRYALFEEMAGIWQTDAIATAHHMDDQAETMLMMLSRGSSLAGAGGIRPVSGKRIHPLLCLRKREIETYLADRQISWCLDATNEENLYSRNRIRHHILPELEESVNRRTVEHFSEAAEDFREMEEYLVRQEEDLLAKYLDAGDEDGEIFLKKEVGAEPLFLQKRLLHRCLIRICGQAKDLTREHVRLLLDIFQGPAGRSIRLPYGTEAHREAEGIRMLSAAAQKRREQTAGACRNLELFLPVPGEILLPERVPDLQEHLSARQIFLRAGENGCSDAGEDRLLPPETHRKIPEKKYTKWIDYAKIKNGLVVRSRRPGDRISLGAGGKHRKLKDYLIDRKIPRQERDELLLVADGQDIVWIIGDRLAADYYVSDTTETIVEIKVMGRENE